MKLEHVKERKAGIEVKSHPKLLIKQVIKQTQKTHRRNEEGINHQPLYTTQPIPTPNIEHTEPSYRTFPQKFPHPPRKETPNNPKMTRLLANVS